MPASRKKCPKRSEIIALDRSLINISKGKTGPGYARIREKNPCTIYHQEPSQPISAFNHCRTAGPGLLLPSETTGKLGKTHEAAGSAWDKPGRPEIAEKETKAVSSVFTLAFCPQVLSGSCAVGWDTNRAWPLTGFRRQSLESGEAGVAGVTRESTGEERATPRKSTGNLHGAPGHSC